MKILIGIIIFAIVVYAAILIYQQYLLRQLKALVEEHDVFDPAALAKAVEEVKTMNLTGKTLGQVEQLDNDFDDLVNSRLPRLETQLDSAYSQTKQYRLFQAYTNKNKATESLRIASQIMNQLTQNLTELKKVDAQHKEAVKALQRKYQGLRKTLLTKSFLYGDSIDLLEKRLAKLEDDNDQFGTLTNEGDHERASRLLADLQTESDQLTELIEQIPPLYQNLKTEFPVQIAELQEGIKTLSDEGYQFEETNLAAQINGLQKDVDEGYVAISELDLTKATELNQGLTMQIDRFYDIMEAEMNAKPQVTANLDTLPKFIAHAKNQNSTLKKELDRLSQNYTLDHDEQETTKDFGEQLATIDTQYQADVEAIHNQSVVFSEVLTRQEDQKLTLEQIERQQQLINESVADLSKEEKKARQTMQQFDFEMHSIKRQVSNLNLPGLGKDYRDYFQVVDDEIDKLTTDINQPQINMEEITKQLIIIQSDLDILKEKTSDLIDSAQLAEQLLQYANRYRLTDTDVANASAEAQRLFDEEFNYAKSLETIATVLDRVEPGSYKRLEDNYYQAKQTGETDLEN